MGFSVLIDVVGSVVIGGFLLLTLIRMNGNATQNTYNFSGELILQENLVAIADLLEYDFRKIGYCENYQVMPKPEENAILYADTSEIIFLTDLMISPDYEQGDGILDTIRYYLGTASELTETPNPNDRILYRTVNGVSGASNLGITYFYIKYYRDSLTAAGSTTLTEILPSSLPKMYIPGTPTGITAMQIDLRVENTSIYNQDENPYHHAFWRQLRLSLRNLKR